MDVNGKKFYELECSCPCGGRIGNDVKMAFAGDGTFVVMGKCVECNRLTSALTNIITVVMSVETGGNQ